MSLVRHVVLAGLVLAITGIASACSPDAAPTPAPATPSPTAAAASTVPVVVPTVIDVRTPAEYAEGHIAGAVNIDVEAADFDARIGELERDAAYLVYCRSSRRSSIAAARMNELGFSTVIDGGAFETLVDQGAPVE